MKKRALILIFLILVFPLISAVGLDIKPSYNQGETMIAKLSGSFTEPVLRDNVRFYRGHVRVPMNNYDIAKIEGDYYIYAQLPENSGNYSISIENTRYYKGAQLTTENIIKNFTINPQEADFSIDKGVIITNKDFYIQVTNLQDSSITIDVNPEITSESSGFFSSLFGGQLVNNSQASLTFNPGETKQIQFQVLNIQNSSLQTIELSSTNTKYDVPVYIFTNNTEIIKAGSLIFDAYYLNVSMPTNDTNVRIVYLKNAGTTTVENINLSVSNELAPFVSLSVSNIDELKSNSSAKIELTFSSQEDEENLIGELKAVSDDIHTSLDVYLDVIPGYTPQNTTNNTEITQTCEELGAYKCSSTEECNGTETDSSDGKCCTGLCQEIPQSNITSKIIGWALIIVILGFLAWFFLKKYRGVKRPVDLLKTAEQGARK